MRVNRLERPDSICACDPVYLLEREREKDRARAGWIITQSRALCRDDGVARSLCTVTSILRHKRFTPVAEYSFAGSCHGERMENCK